MPAKVWRKSFCRADSVQVLAKHPPDGLADKFPLLGMGQVIEFSQTGQIHLRTTEGYPSGQKPAQIHLAEFAQVTLRFFFWFHGYPPAVSGASVLIARILLIS